MYQLLLSAVLALSFSVANAGSKRTQCHPDTSNVIPNTCECDISNDLGEKTGLALFSCDDLACEEFETNQQPQTCAPGTRGITCDLYNQKYFMGCPLGAPRVEAEISAEAFCGLATSSLEKESTQSPYYRFLNRTLCSPAGFSFPPADGWVFTGGFIEGWD